MSDESVFFVWQPKAVTGLSALVASEPLESWKDWLTFHAIEETASFLPRAFVAEHFAFDGKARPRHSPVTRTLAARCRLHEAALGEAVGTLRRAVFSTRSKSQSEGDGRRSKSAFPGNRIDSLAWMSAATKARAKEKLSTLIVGVGYPDQWRITRAEGEQGRRSG